MITHNINAYALSDGTGCLHIEELTHISNSVSHLLHCRFDQFQTAVFSTLLDLNSCIFYVSVTSTTGLSVVVFQEKFHSMTYSINKPQKPILHSFLPFQHVAFKTSLFLQNVAYSRALYLHVGFYC